MLVSLCLDNRLNETHYAGCAANQATCMNGECISKDKICNKEFDCSDGSDEKGCSKWFFLT